jgi:hypothetical protein
MSRRLHKPVAAACNFGSLGSDDSVVTVATAPARAAHCNSRGPLESGDPYQVATGPGARSPLQQLAPCLFA